VAREYEYCCPTDLGLPKKMASFSKINMAIFIKFSFASQEPAASISTMPFYPEEGNTKHPGNVATYLPS
jgi:hypothetical protein